jgi:multiple sugar transport system substrate-binding protein
MRTNRRSLRCAALAAALTLTLGAVTAGCSSGIAQGFGLGSSGVPSSALCPGKKPAANITVVDLWWPFASPLINSSAAAFNCDHPDIAVNISVNDQVGDDSNGKLLAAVAAHKPPDLVMSWDDMLTAWAAKGELQPIESHADSLGIKSSDYIEQAWQSTQWKGHQYGVPVDWDPDAMLWYNKKVFAEVGLDPNKPPTTWAQVQDYGDKIDKVENGRIQRLGFIPWDGWQFNYVQLGHQFGAPFDTGADQSVVIDSPQMRDLFTYQQGVARKFGGAAKINSFTTVTGAQGSAADPLLSGRVGMRLIGDWELGQQANVGAKAFRETLGVTLMPSPPGGQPYLSHSGWSFMVPSGAKHVDAAMVYVDWMLASDHFGTYIGPANGWLPAKSETRSQKYLTSDPTWLDILAIDQKGGSGWWLQPSPLLGPYYRFLDEAQSELTSLDGTPSGVLSQAQSQTEAALANAIALGVYDQ